MQFLDAITEIFGTFFINILQLLFGEIRIPF